MNIKTLTPKRALNKAYQKVTVFREEFDLFKQNLSRLLSNIDKEESEENVKTHLKDFLYETYYKNINLLNAKGKTDLAIYLSNKQSSKAGVLLEVKRPVNKAEMLSADNLNKKALHELILYYLRERVEKKNDEIKYLIATNIYEWFIFDANLFENLFYKNKKFLENFNKWNNDEKVSFRTDHFYDEIAKPYLDEISSEISFTYFNLADYKKLLTKTGKESERKLISLYKILSPVHLLKKPFANDSNSLDRNFYNELLHIIGLEEVKVKNKKVIERKREGERDTGSFIENAIEILKTDAALERIKNAEKYGEDEEEQLFHIALELSLTWINRILFLKLLESQLVNYHKSGDYKFLNVKFIKDFDELYRLFHSVLAIKAAERRTEIKEKYFRVPYLNSSLFEISALENEAFRINSLSDSVQIEIYSGTVLKNRNGKKRIEKLNALDYLFEFLDAYNFTSEGKEEIEEERKTLINASVLGLIFEKINGYKDGSYFTPGFITMYMSRETIRRAVIQKFNAQYSWKCETFDDLKNHLAERRNTKDIIEANAVINSLKICDPAVGSGHFLVSALNEIITIKSELGILADENGVVLTGYYVKTENDELIVTYNYGEEIFEYHPPEKNETESQRVQRSIFNEKRTIIENCLFGVDINPNSVKIAQLRLWIELLKNAYYTKKSGYAELETLPNIDINIKEGNSLVSKFDIKQDIFSKSDRKVLEIYKLNVNLYKNEQDREKRRELKKSIDKTKKMFQGFLVDPLKKETDQIEKLTAQLHVLNTENLFDSKTEADTGKIEKKRTDLREKINKLSQQRKTKAEEYRALYSNAFEWRFEFPEVLDEDGNFTGFDIVIGNPPYMFGGNEGISKIEKFFFNKNYYCGQGKINLFNLFIEKGTSIAKVNGFMNLIIPNTFLRVTSYFATRKYVLDNFKLVQIADFGEKVFDDAITTAIVILINIEKPNENEITEIRSGINDLTKIQQLEFIKKDYIISLSNDEIGNHIYDKLNFDSVLLGEITDELIFGVVITKNQNEIVSNSKNENWKSFVEGRDIGSYYIKPITKYLNYKPELLHRARTKSIFEVEEKLLIQRITGGNRPLKAAYDNEQLYTKESINNLILHKNNSYKIKYILGLLNSKLINWFYTKRFTNESKLTVNLSKEYLSKIPIKKAKEQHQVEMIELVDQILEIKKQNPESDSRELESEIDQIVYKLYGLTEEEIKIVEGKG